MFLYICNAMYFYTCKNTKKFVKKKKFEII